MASKEQLWVEMVGKVTESAGKIDETIKDDCLSFLYFRKKSEWLPPSDIITFKDSITAIWNGHAVDVKVIFKEKGKALCSIIEHKHNKNKEYYLERCGDSWA